jgi:hypothetical protein
LVYNPQTTYMNLGPLSCFASTNSWFVTEKSPKVRSLWFRNSCELQHSNLKWQLHCKLKWREKTNRWEFVLVKVLHTIQ